MTEPVIRPATHADIEQLVEMRSDFTFEDARLDPSDSRPEYVDETRAFLEAAIETESWQIWVAEIDGQIVAHVFVALIDKVPRPVRENSRIAYLTNVYTRPGFRDKGTGARLIEHAQKAAKDARVELMIVWPSDESALFYRRHGFAAPDDPLIWEPR